MNNLRTLYWRLFRPEVYGAYIEVCRLKACLDKARKNHSKRKNIEKQYFDLRARFELLRKGK